MKFEEQLRTPQFTLGVFLGIFLLLMSYIGRKVESRTYILIRCVALFVTWLLIRIIYRHAGGEWGWGLTISIMVLLSVNLWQRIRYTNDPIHQETLEKIINFRID